MQPVDVLQMHYKSASKMVKEWKAQYTARQDGAVEKLRCIDLLLISTLANHCVWWWQPRGGGGEVICGIYLPCLLAAGCCAPGSPLFSCRSHFSFGRLGFHLLPCLPAFAHSLAMRQKVFKLLKECRHHFNWWINQITGSQCEAQGMG